MSVKIYPDVLYLKMGAGRKLVLAVLAEHASEDGVCWPSQALLAHRASISIRNLRVHLRALEEDGWIVVDVGTGPGGVNHYYLNIEKINAAASIERERISQEKSSLRSTYVPKFAIEPLVTPDVRDNNPDDEDISPDVESSPPDAQDEQLDPSILQNRHEPLIEPPHELSAELSYAHFQKIDEPISSLAENANSVFGYFNEPAFSPPPNSEPPPSTVDKEIVKFNALERLKGWAELEHGDSTLSKQQNSNLQIALEYACAFLSRTELLTELETWDFLDGEAKDAWKVRIELPYSSTIQAD